MTTAQNRLLTVTPTDETFATWLNKPYISQQLHEYLSKSNVLFVPKENRARVDSPVFYQGTHELFRYLKEANRPDLHPEVCIEEQDYNEVSLNSELLVIGAFIATALVLPVVTDLIGEFIKRKLWKNVESATVKCEIIVVSEALPEGASKQAVKISYEGPALEFQEVILKAAQNTKQNTLSLSEEQPNEPSNS